MRVLHLVAPALLLLGAACAESATTPAASAGRPGETTISPDGLYLNASPQPASAGDTVTVTATMHPWGSYHYTWTSQRCSVVQGEPEMRCSLPITVGAQDLTSRKYKVGYDMEWRINVVVRQSAGGTVLDGDEIYVYGPDSY